MCLAPERPTRVFTRDDGSRLARDTVVLPFRLYTVADFGLALVVVFFFTVRPARVERFFGTVCFGDVFLADVVRFWDTVFFFDDFLAAGFFFEVVFFLAVFPGFFIVI
jgi:hypothetical protein